MDTTAHIRKGSQSLETFCSHQQIKHRMVALGLVGTWYPMLNGLFERWKTHVLTGSEIGAY
jgi:hypothetical protein